MSDDFVVLLAPCFHCRLGVEAGNDGPEMPQIVPGGDDHARFIVYWPTHLKCPEPPTITIGVGSTLGVPAVIGDWTPGAAPNDRRYFMTLKDGA